MTANGTKRNCLGAHGNFRSRGQTGCTVNLPTTAALKPKLKLSVRTPANAVSSRAPSTARR